MEQKPLIRFDAHQQAVFWSTARTLFLLWRRQAGKSFTLGAWGLYRMMQIPGHLVVFCSASVSLGKELVYKEAAVWRIFTQAYRSLVKDQGQMLTTTADTDSGELLDVDAIADLFEAQKLETKIHHDRTTVSRSMVVAPNPDTAVGWTGDVILDEVGRVMQLKDLLEALGPIMTRNRDFQMRMATTISPDEAHYSREIHGYPVNQGEFPISASGNFYTSKSGYSVHRFDAYDAHAGGLALYDDKTGAELTPEQHRAASLDKSGWDRNYGLEEVSGGTSAIPAGVLTRCLREGQGQCLGIDVTDALSPVDVPDLFPAGWQDLIDPSKPRLSLGYDIATTTKKKSNPSSITLMQQVGLMFAARLLIRFKTGDPDVARAIIDSILLGLLPRGLRVGRLVIDATSERFYAIETRRHFSGRLPVDLVIASETLQYRGETLLFKTYQGNLLVNTACDGYLALPSEEWIERDWKLVKTEKGMFWAELDEAGNHADTFDSTKQALYGLLGDVSAPAEAKAANVGGNVSVPRPGILNPYANRFETKGTGLNV